MREREGEGGRERDLAGALDKSKWIRHLRVWVTVKYRTTSIIKKRNPPRATRGP